MTVDLPMLTFDLPMLTFDLLMLTFQSDLDTLLQYDCGERVEVRTLLSTEAVEKVDGFMAVTDVDATGQRYVRFWIDDTHDSSVEERAAPRVADEYEEVLPSREPPVSATTLPVFGVRPMSRG